MLGMRAILSGLARIRAGRRRRRGLGRFGFTMLELVIVVEIIGFLAMIVLSNYFRSKKAAQVAVTLQSIRNVQTALASYYVMENEYPATINTIWLQFYGGRVAEQLDYIGGITAGNSDGWSFFASNSHEIRFSGPSDQEYALRSTENLLPYALYIYADVATSAKIVR